MSETPRTDARLRELVAKWRTGEDADSHIIEDLMDFTGSLERDLLAAAERIEHLQAKVRELEKSKVEEKATLAALTNGTGEIVCSNGNRHKMTSGDCLYCRAAQAEAKVRELEESTKVTMVMRLRNQYDEQVKRAEQAEARLAAHEAERAAAVAEALERAAQECEEWAESVERVGKHKEQAFAYRAAASAIRALKPRSDLVCVPRAMFAPDVDSQGRNIWRQDWALHGNSLDEAIGWLAAAEEGE